MRNRYSRLFRLRRLLIMQAGSLHLKSFLLVATCLSNLFLGLLWLLNDASFLSRLDLRPQFLKLLKSLPSILSGSLLDRPLALLHGIVLSLFALNTGTV